MQLKHFSLISFDKAGLVQFRGGDESDLKIASLNGGDDSNRDSSRECLIQAVISQELDGHLKKGDTSDAIINLDGGGS